MQEFVYYSPGSPEFPLSQDIFLTSEKSTSSSEKYIVSNSKEVEAEILAKEINFYIENSQDPIAKQIKNIEKLYEVNAIRFDLGQDMSYTQEVDNRLLLIATAQEKVMFEEGLSAGEFDLYYVPGEEVNSISGHIGNLTVRVQGKEHEVPLNVSQIVWFNQAQIAKEQSGSFDPLDNSVEETLKTVRANIQSYEYKNFIVYDKTICQYHERREEVCSKCEEVCPTVAIVKHDEQKHLEFSQIDCHGCGGCISVCPSGALDYTPSNRESIFEMAKMYKEHIALVIPQKMQIETLEVELKERVLPLAVEGEKFLHEGTFLTLLQESGAQVVFYTDFLSKGTKDAIFILNQIYQKRFGKDAVLLAMNKDELTEALEVASFIEGSRYSFNEEGAKKREIFAIRLRHIVGEDDLGVVSTGEHVHYAQVKVKESNCTLCLSCVGACNVGALIANTEDNTLRLNSSICTSCGYCELSCPEADCMSLERDVIKLNPSWFKEEVLAKDTLFKCVECAKPFATTKAVEKIAAILAPKFANDPVKVRTLYCCEDCKPKIMMQSYMNNQDAYAKKGVKS